MNRVAVCCRVDVRDRFGVWTAVTEDISDRGCRLVTAKLPRVGALLEMTLSSDLFSEQLQVLGRTMWVTSKRIGVTFLESRDRSLTPTHWLERVIEHGAMGPREVDAPRVAPVVQRGGRGAASAEDGVVVRLPVKRR